MCGIFGFVGRREQAESLDLEVALRALHHRGPDDRGTFRGIADADGTRACALAHTRLSIIDLSPAGHQPMSTEDGRFTIVYNGEVYNFEEIRASLQREGVLFHSTCDTEVVLQAYVRWGAECVAKFRGMFAFAIWDRVRGACFVARDRFGIKPLYYVERSDGFGFASELRTLLALGLSDRTLSLDGLGSYLRFGSISEPLTIIEGVRSLRPGHVGSWDGTFSGQRYWAMPSSHPSRQTLEQTSRELHDVLLEAVRQELVADVPLGIFLSGGIDSSGLVAVAAAASAQPVHSFTVTFDEQSYNEERFAASVATRFGCDHHEVRLPVAKVQAELETVFRAMDQPSADGLNTYFVAQAARQAGLSVALSGLGGDELFAGYPNFRSMGRYVRMGSIGKLIPHAFIDRMHASSDVSNRVKKMLAVAGARGSAEGTYAALRAMFFDAQILEMAPALQDRLPGFAPNGGGRGTSDYVSLYSQFELDNYLPNTLLRDTDCMSMAHSLEVRVPLLDHVLAELVGALPGHMKLSNSVNKPLLLAAIGRPLPDDVVHRPKMGFTLPLDSWFRGPLSATMTSLLDSEESALPAIFDRAAVRRLWSAFMKGERYVTFSRVWSIAALAGWCRENGVSE